MLTVRLFLYIVVGAVAGYGWHRLVGCSSGACPLTSNPWLMTAYGGFMGYALGSG
ncbi:MAG: YtxH domain-containing protein [Alphaproteobacteria bacterium]|nr:YtxH domain-containing protein [Alphaproteobacteria bacterium]